MASRRSLGPSSNVIFGTPCFQNPPSHGWSMRNLSSRIMIKYDQYPMYYIIYPKNAKNHQPTIIYQTNMPVFLNINPPLFLLDKSQLFVVDFVVAAPVCWSSPAQLWMVLMVGPPYIRMPKIQVNSQQVKISKIKMKWIPLPKKLFPSSNQTWLDNPIIFVYDFSQSHPDLWMIFMDVPIFMNDFHEFIFSCKVVPQFVS